MPLERRTELAAVLDAIRGSDGIGQLQLVRDLGLGRTVVAQRVAELSAVDLVTQHGRGPSTGGRAPRLLRLRAEAGLIAGADIGATRMVVGLLDLAGRVRSSVEVPIDIAGGPEAVLSRVEALIDEQLAAGPPGGQLWGFGVGVPGPVEFASGLPVAPPIMPGWDGYPIRERLAARFRAPVWVDNDVNLRALAELRTNPAAAAAGDLLYVKIGTGIGAGLVSQGRVHRGVSGCAGDIGHVAIAEGAEIICRCGQEGCLEAIAGGAALLREGLRLATGGASAYLATVLQEHGTLTIDDLAAATRHGDPVVRTLLTRAGRLVGSTLATLVSFFNPGLVVVGGRVAHSGDFVLAAMREAIYRRSLPLATRALRVELSTLGDAAGLTGAAHLVTDCLFAADRLDRWLPLGTPAGHPEVAADPTETAA